MQLAKITDFRLSQWLDIYGDSVLGLLNCVEVAMLPTFWRYMQPPSPG
jgi:hypothetical protein